MIIIRKRILIMVSVLLVFVCSAGFIISKAAGSSKIKVIVDAGHGDPDGGAVGVSGILEKDINLQIAMKLREVLDGKGYITIMTRTGDKGIYDSDSATIRQMKKSDMNKRLNIMKKSNADLFITIHMNSFENIKANGLHIFYSANHSEIKQLAEDIQQRIAEITGAATHAVEAADDSLFLMKNPPIPAILAECGFLSNPEEEKKLVNEEYQAKLAWAIAEAVDEYYTTE